MNKKKQKPVYYYINLVIQFFVETFVAMALGYFIGKYLDEQLFESEATLIYVFIILGIFAGLSNLIKRVLKTIKEGEEDEKDQSD
ncbi:MAG: AtpZ/AtpI family protein [Candidatus Izemoplasmatales bacterium]|jgi:F0F1-type ATP synthase assembly protein I